MSISTLLKRKEKRMLLHYLFTSNMTLRGDTNTFHIEEIYIKAFSFYMKHIEENLDVKDVPKVFECKKKLPYMVSPSGHRTVIFPF